MAGFGSSKIKNSIPDSYGKGLDLSFLKGKQVVDSGLVEGNDGFPGFAIDYAEGEEIKRIVVCHDRQFGYYADYHGNKGEKTKKELLVDKIRLHLDGLCSNPENVEISKLFFRREYLFLKKDSPETCIIMDIKLEELELMDSSVSSLLNADGKIDSPAVIRAINDWFWVQ